MKVRIACISVALLAALPASAADWNEGAGSLKDMNGGAAVAVPAPVPVQTYRGAWYFRFDGGIGSIGTPSLSETGLDIGDRDGPAAVLPATGPDYRATQPDWFSSDFSTFATVGGGAGYNFSNGFRIDGTIEKRFQDSVELSGTDQWETHRFCNAGCWGATTNTTNFEVKDSTKIDGTLWMVNAYYDLFSNRGFTPYIGAGIGFAWNELNRRHESTYTVCGARDPSCEFTTGRTVTESASGRANNFTLAYAAMAGVSYDLSEMTAVDLGYRYLFISGSDIALDINDDISRVEIGDQHVHQFRAGLRFNVN
jgi:opacity protein-like surface antigen